MVALKKRCSGKCVCCEALRDIKKLLLKIQERKDRIEKLMEDLGKPILSPIVRKSRKQLAKEYPKK